MNCLTSYEKAALDEVKKWESEEPSVVAKVTDFVLKPASWVIQKVVPPKAIEGALTMACKAAEALTDVDDIKRDAHISSIKELQSKALELSDKLCEEVRSWAMGVAFVEGAATGMEGIFGAAIDIPALITLALRTIHKIALCYGFECKSQEDHIYLLQIMSVAGSNTMRDKIAALTALAGMQDIIVKQTWKKIAEKAGENAASKEALIIAIKNAAKQLGINITKRTAAKVVPLAGAAVGAGINTAFIMDVSKAAKMCMREQWLKQNGKI